MNPTSQERSTMERDEIIEELRSLDFAHQIGWVAGNVDEFVCACGFHSDQMDAPEVHRATIAVDALTKPRTEKCLCRDRNAEAKRLADGLPADVSDASMEAVEQVLRATYDALHPCVCSGSGTVTRGPIAVLVPPDAVEIMARAKHDFVWADAPPLGPRAWEDMPEWYQERELTRMAPALDALYRRTGLR